MSTDTTTADAPVIDTASDAYADYVACDVNGVSQRVRADERGIAPATVSANVRRIRALIANGATVDGDASTGTVVVPFGAWVTAAYGDDAGFAVSVIDNAIADAMRSHDRARALVARATAAMDDADARIARAGSMFDTATGDDVPSFDDIRTAYTAYADAARADAPTPVDTPTDDTPTDDAPSDGDDA